MVKTITSVQNAFIKQIIQLRDKSRARKTTETFLIEGVREINLAIKGHYKLNHLLYCKDLCNEEELNTLSKETGVECIEISKEVYQKIAYRATTEGVVAVAQTKKTDLNHLSFKNNTPLILVAEAPEKPGNIGALLRTADAANIDAVIIANPKTDLYNPNIIRSSVGCVFTKQVATGNTDEIISYLKEKKINIYAAILQEAKAYNTENYTNATAIVVGTEATGLSDAWRKHSKQNIKIPMQGVIDSMNVSVAAGILVFEAKRQRHFK